MEKDSLMKYLLISGFFFLATGVMLGAFGAHLLQNKLEPHSLEVFETGVRYQFIHGLGLLLLVALGRSFGTESFVHPGYALLLGSLLFCGSLYGVSLLGIKKLGMVAPIGGTALILGWLWSMKIAWGLWTP